MTVKYVIPRHFAHITQSANAKDASDHQTAEETTWQNSSSQRIGMWLAKTQRGTTNPPSPPNAVLAMTIRHGLSSIIHLCPSLPTNSKITAVTPHRPNSWGYVNINHKATTRQCVESVRTQRWRHSITWCCYPEGRRWCQPEGHVANAWSLASTSFWTGSTWPLHGPLPPHLLSLLLHFLRLVAMCGDVGEECEMRAGRARVWRKKKKTSENREREREENIWQQLPAPCPFFPWPGPARPGPASQVPGPREWYV